MPFPLHTNTAERVPQEVAAFIETLRPHFPPRQFVTITIGSKKGAGVRVEVYAQADLQPARHYQKQGREIIEEYHQIVVDVKADDKAGGATAAHAVYNILKAQFLARAGRQALLAQGLYEVRENAEAPEFDETQFQRPLLLTCNTDCFLT